MSGSQGYEQQQAGGLPAGVREGYDLLVGQVHAPLFFEKLANDYGIVANSDEERAALLEMAGVLQNAQAQDMAKEASAGHSPLVAALDELKGSLTDDGYWDRSAPLAETSHDRMLKAAAAGLAASPELQDAALAWAAYQQSRLPS